MHNHKQYPDFRTVRQWAKEGFLPKKGAKGIELWSNRYCQHSYLYFGPDEVKAATAEQLKAFFKPERDIRNEKARERRKRQKKIRQKEAEWLKKYQQIETEREKFKNANKDVIIDKNRILVIDTATTGLDPYEDELLRISVLDINGKILFDQYFKPKAKSWKEAQEVNGITPEMVKKAPILSEKTKKELNELIYPAAKIIGYSTYFDLGFLECNGIYYSEKAEIIDVMEEYAFARGYDYWQKLTTAANYYNYQPPSGAYNSLSNCYATLHIYNCLNKKTK